MLLLHSNWKVSSGFATVMEKNIADRRFSVEVDVATPAGSLRTSAESMMRERKVSVGRHVVS